LFDIFREIDAYLADIAQLSNHAVDAAELRTTAGAVALDSRWGSRDRDRHSAPIRSNPG